MGRIAYLCAPVLCFVQVIIEHRFDSKFCRSFVVLDPTSPTKNIPSEIVVRITNSRSRFSFIYRWISSAFFPLSSCSLVFDKHKHWTMALGAPLKWVRALDFSFLFTDDLFDSLQHPRLEQLESFRLQHQRRFNPTNRWYHRRIGSRCCWIRIRSPDPPLPLPNSHPRSLSSF